LILKVTIITVVWNNVATIEDAIHSVLQQTYDDIEYIVVDGFSSDGTRELVSRYENSLAKFISEPDKGLWDAMNKGIQLATGDVVGILNSDDFYSNKYVIENVVHQFKMKKVDSVFGDLVYVKPQNLSKSMRYFDSSKFNISKFAYGLMPAHPTFFVKRKVYQEYGVFRTDLQAAGDFDLLVRFLFSHRISYSYIQEVLVVMRIGGVSTTLTSFWTNTKEQLKVCRNNGIDTNLFKILSKYLIKAQGIFKKNDIEKWF
jgi:glycosyltransferase involved in cell wall biosynthesis